MTDSTGHFTYRLMNIPHTIKNEHVHSLFSEDDRRAIILTSIDPCPYIRSLVQDGVLSTQLCGLDLEPEFIDLGHRVFHDRDTLQATLVSGDIWRGTAARKLRTCQIAGAMDMVLTSSLLPVWFSGKSSEVSCFHDSVVDEDRSL